MESKILLLHGVGHQSQNDNWDRSWRDALKRYLREKQPGLDLDFSAPSYDDLFERELPTTTVEEIKALGVLGWSLLSHYFGDLFHTTPKTRGLLLPTSAQWTAGMVAKWAVKEPLRQQLRQWVTDKIQKQQPQVIIAHSMGSLLAYDTFLANPDLVKGRVFLCFGSQIGNPGVRNVFGGKIKPLPASRWFHLHNKHDDVLTAPIHLSDALFSEIPTPFNFPGVGDHNATVEERPMESSSDNQIYDAYGYLDHPTTKEKVWPWVAQFLAAQPRAVRKDSAKSSLLTAPVAPAPVTIPFHIQIAETQRHRALLVGIDTYADPSVPTLSGCVNDTWLMSRTLQECGLHVDGIRMLHNERATTSALFERLDWLLDDAQPGDHRILHFSGHGVQMPDYGPQEEADHFDEWLVPHDFDKSPEKSLQDDQLYSMYAALPYETHLMVILDCCHAGGGKRDILGTGVRGILPPEDIQHRALIWDRDAQMWVPRKFPSQVEDAKKSALLKKVPFRKPERFFGENGSKRRLFKASTARTNGIGGMEPYMPVLLMACAEEQQAHEYRAGSVPYGAFTFALTSAFDHLRKLNQMGTSYAEVMKEAKRRTMKLLALPQEPQIDGPSAKLTTPLLGWNQEKKGKVTRPKKKMAKK